MKVAGFLKLEVQNNTHPFRSIRFFKFLMKDLLINVGYICQIVQISSLRDYTKLPDGSIPSESFQAWRIGACARMDQFRIPAWRDSPRNT